MASHLRKRELVSFGIIAFLAGLNVLQYQLVEYKNGSNLAYGRPPGLSLEHSIDGRSVAAVSSPLQVQQPEGQMRNVARDSNRDLIESTPSIGEGVPTAASLHEVRRKLDSALQEIGALKTQAFQDQFLKSESPNRNSLRAVALLEENYTSTEAIDVVDMELRWCFRGTVVADDDLIWMGDCAENNNWPILDQYGDPEIELSMAKRLGPKRLVKELDMNSLWNLVQEASEGDVVAVWGDTLAELYHRLPETYQADLRTQYPNALKFVEQ